MFIKRAFNITKDNIILAQPLVLYLVLISLTMAGLAQQNNKITFIIFAVSNILLSTAFFAGWFYMAKKTVEHSRKEFENPEEKSLASLALLKDFFPGVGEFFIPVTVAMLLYIGGYLLTLYLGYRIGIQILPNPEININTLIAAQTPEQMQKFLASLSFGQLKALNLWFMYVAGILTAFTYLTLFWFPALIYDSKNPLIAFWKNIQFLFKNFIGTMGILIFLLFFNLVISMMSLIFNVNIILSIIGLVITFYFMTYCLILIFLYYDEKRKVKS